MSKGIIVLSTKSGGLLEIIEDNKNGFLFEVENNDELIEKMSKKIEYLIKNPDLYFKISKNAIETAKKWTMEKFSKIQREKILELLKNEQ